MWIPVEDRETPDTPSQGQLAVILASWSMEEIRELIKEIEAELVPATTAFLGTRMTGEESRKLKSGDRVFCQGDVKNQGTVKGTSWSAVTINWDDGDTTSVNHDDMAPISRAH